MGKVSLLQAIDHPAVNSAIFFPRPATGLPALPGSEDLTIPVGGGVSVAARYHPSDLSGPTVLHFHGNGEIVPDYDDIAPAFLSCTQRGMSCFRPGTGSGFTSEPPRTRKDW